MTERRLKYFGWGREGDGMTSEEEAFEFRRLGERFGIERFDGVAPPRLEDIKLATPRVSPPASLAPICSIELYDRVAHTYGKAYPDYVRALHGDFAPAPDVVAYPRNEAEVAALLDWAGETQSAVTPLSKPPARGQLAPVIVPVGRHMGAMRDLVGMRVDIVVEHEDDQPAIVMQQLLLFSVHLGT